MADIGGDGRPDPTLIRDRQEFAAQLSAVRVRTGKTIRALARELDQPSATIGGYFSGQHLPSVAQTELFRSLLRGLGILEQREIESWIDALARVRRRPGPRPATAPVPYRGLVSFQVEDAGWFFGREVLADAVVRRAAELVKDPADGTAMVVVGPSGSGKSSLLRAGVVPSIEGGTTDLGSSWHCAVVCPGTQPVVRLAEALAAISDGDPEAIEEGLRRDPSDWPVEPGSNGLVVVFDQFEEVFTTSTDEERRAVLAIVEGASRVIPEDRAQVVVIVGLRADFYGRAAREPSLVSVLQDRQVLVGPMSAEELRRAIREPARLAGMDVDDDLVDHLLAEVAPRPSAVAPHEPGALPLLSHALLETWKGAKRGRLTMAAYTATGGIGGAVQKTADRLFGDLTPDEQILARRLFLRLVNLEEDAVVTRRRIRRGDLPAHDALEGVIELFVSHRLLTLDAGTVEVAHEALIVAWPRLREWVEADRAGLVVHRQLGEAAQAWSDGDREPAALLRGNRLVVAEAWASALDHRDDLNEIERSYLDASVEHAREEEVAARRRARRLQALVAFVATLAVVAVSLAAVAVRAQASAVTARDAALSRQLASQSTRLRSTDPFLSRQLALTGYRIAPTLEAHSALLDASALPSSTRLLGQSGETALATSSDGTTFAVSRALDGTVQLFFVGEGGMPVRGALLPPATPGHHAFALALSSDGTMLAAGGTDDAVTLWDLRDRAAPRRLGEALRGFAGAVQSLAFSPDGGALIAGGVAAAVLHWDVTNASRPVELAPLTGMTGTTQSVAFSPDGRAIAAAGTDSTLRIWRNGGGGAAAFELATEMPVIPETTINAIAFSPDGRMVAAGSKDKTLRVWSLAPEWPPAELGPPLTGFGSWVNAVTFSDDSRTLAAGSSDNSIRFWAVDGLQPLPPVLTSPSPVTGVGFLRGKAAVVSVATDGAAHVWRWPGALLGGALDTVFGLSYSSDGQRLAVFPNRGDDTVRIWDTRGSGQARLVGAIKVPPEIGKLGGTGAISPDGRTLAVALRPSNVVRQWDVTDLSHPVLLETTFSGPTDLIEYVAFNGSGTLLAAGSDDGTVRLWDPKAPGNGAPVATLTGPEGLVLAITFSRDARFLAAASADKRVYRWDISSPRQPVALPTLNGFDSYAYSVAFSPDGRLLAAGSADKTLRLWDVTDPRRPRALGQPLSGPGNYVYSVAFNPSGAVLAAGVTDGSVWQWDVTDPRRPKQIAMLTAASTGQVFIAAYSPDGDVLVAGDDKVVHVWMTDKRRIEAEVCAMAGDGITAKEWAHYLPDQRYRPPCQ